MFRAQLCYFEENRSKKVRELGKKMTGYEQIYMLVFYHFSVIIDPINKIMESFFLDDQTIQHTIQIFK